MGQECLCKGNEARSQDRTLKSFCKAGCKQMEVKYTLGLVKI